MSRREGAVGGCVVCPVRRVEHRQPTGTARFCVTPYVAGTMGTGGSAGCDACSGCPLRSPGRRVGGGPGRCAPKSFLSWADSRATAVLDLCRHTKSCCGRAECHGTMRERLLAACLRETRPGSACRRGRRRAPQPAVALINTLSPPIPPPYPACTAHRAGASQCPPSHRGGVTAGASRK